MSHFEIWINFGEFRDNFRRTVGYGARKSAGETAFEQMTPIVDHEVLKRTATNVTSSVVAWHLNDYLEEEFK